MRVQLSERRRSSRRGRVAAVLVSALAVARGAGAQAPASHQPEPPPLATPVEAASTAASSTVVRVGSELAGYADTDHVFVVSPGIHGSAESPTEGWSVGGSYLVDVVSAASVDIVSTASRRWEEVRQAGTADVGYKPGSFGVAASAALSVEPDYTSLNGGFVLTEDLLRKNLTLLGGYEHGHDIAGRSGTPFSVFAHVIDHDALKGGLTLVLDPRTIATGIAEVSFERGDTSKPYRYIPLFAPGTGVARGASIDAVNAARLSERVLEQLPLWRDRFVLTLRLAHRFESSTFRVDERVYRDTWGLSASTSDVRFLVDATRHFEIGPHVRVHAQTPVSFWQRAYIASPGFSFPALRTGDRELGPLWNATLGGSMRFGFGPSYDPMRWAIGVDLNANYTWYLNDLYVTHRISTVGGLGLEGTL